MKNINALIKIFNKKRYRRIIKKNKYSFKMNICPISISGYSQLAYGIIAKNHNTKKV